MVDENVLTAKELTASEIAHTEDVDARVNEVGGLFVRLEQAIGKDKTTAYIVPIWDIVANGSIHPSAIVYCNRALEVADELDEAGDKFTEKLLDLFELPEELSKLLKDANEPTISPVERAFITAVANYNPDTEKVGEEFYQLIDDMLGIEHDIEHGIEDEQNKEKE